jgi:hypothetical protein
MMSGLLRWWPLLAHGAVAAGSRCCCCPRRDAHRARAARAAAVTPIFGSQSQTHQLVDVDTTLKPDITLLITDITPLYFDTVVGSNDCLSAAGACLPCV